MTFNSFHTLVSTVADLGEGPGALGSYVMGGNFRAYKAKTCLDPHCNLRSKRLENVSGRCTLVRSLGPPLG